MQKNTAFLLFITVIDCYLVFANFIGRREGAVWQVWQLGRTQRDLGLTSSQEVLVPRPWFSCLFHGAGDATCGLAPVSRCNRTEPHSRQEIWLIELLDCWYFSWPHLSVYVCCFKMHSVCRGQKLGKWSPISFCVVSTCPSLLPPSQERHHSSLQWVKQNCSVREGFTESWRGR